MKVGESALCIAMVASGAIAATEADYHPAARWLSGLTRRAVTNAPQTSCPPPVESHGGAVDAAPVV